MARVTVEDCIEKIPNRFDLVLTAGQRARGILKGDLPTIDRDDDKNPVIALREIEQGLVTAAILTEIPQDYEIVDAVPETEEASTEAPQKPAI